MSPPSGGLPDHLIQPFSLQVIVHHIYFILSSKQLSLWNDFIYLFIFFLPLLLLRSGSCLYSLDSARQLKTYPIMMCWMNEWINIQWCLAVSKCPESEPWSSCASCRCCALHNRRRHGTLCMAHSVDTDTATCSNHGVLGPSWDGSNWKAQIPKKVQRPQLQVVGASSRARPLAGFH